MYCIMIAQISQIRNLNPVVQKFVFLHNKLFGGWHKTQDETCLCVVLPDSILLGFGDAVALGRCVVVEVGVGVVDGVVGVGSGIERLQLGPCSSSSMTFSAQTVYSQVKIHGLSWLQYNLTCALIKLVDPQFIFEAQFSALSNRFRTAG